MMTVRVKFSLTKELYEELMDNENGKYPNTTAYIRAIVHEHLTQVLNQKDSDWMAKRKKRLAGEKTQDDPSELEYLKRMYEEMYGED